MVEIADKLILIRQKLIALRKAQGLSQEDVANSCQSKGFCVSLSSLKRAETEKSISLRTARDLAKFYAIEMTELIDDALTNTNVFLGNKNSNSLIGRTEALSGSQSQSEAGLSITCSEKNILLLCVALGDDNKHIDKIMQGLYDYHACVCSLNSENMIFALLGALKHEEKFYLQAVECALFLHNIDSSLVVALQPFTPKFDTPSATKLMYRDEVLQQKVEIPLGTRVRMEVQLAQLPPATILLENDLHSMVAEDFEAQPLRVGDGTNRWWALRARRMAPAHFVGREFFLQQFDRARTAFLQQGRGSWIYISGIAGIGKTQLSLALIDKLSAEQLRDTKIEVISCYLLKYGEMEVRSPIALLLFQLLHLGTSATADQVTKRLGELKLLPSLQPFILRMMDLPLADIEQRLFAFMTHDHLQEQSIVAFKRLLEEVLRRRAIVFLIEDLHWLDSDMEWALKGLAGVVADLPCIVISTTRPEGDMYPSPSWIQNAMSFELEAFTSEESIQLARQLLGQGNDENVQHCIKTSAGHPLFLKELLLHQSRENALPATIYNLVASKTQGLAPNALDMLRMAAVIGQRFSAQQLAKLLPGFSVALDLINDSNLILLQGSYYLFTHELIRQAVYRDIPPSQCAAYHLRCAEYYRQINKPVYYAEHLGFAKDERAVEALLEAAKFLQRNFRFDKANELIDQGIAIIEQQNENPASHRLFIEKADILLALGQPERSIQYYEKAIECCDDETQAARYWLALSYPYRLLEKTADSLIALDSCELLAKRSGATEILSRIYNMRGNLSFPTGELEQSEGYQQQALAFADQAANTHARCKALGGLGDCAYAQGKMATGLKLFEECLHIAEQENYLDVESANRFMLGTMRIYQLQTEKALSDAQQSAFLAKQTGDNRAEIVSRLTAGWILLDLEQLDEAELEIETALSIARRLSAIRFIAFLLESRARLHHQRGDRQQAQADIQAALSIVKDHAFQAFIGPWVAATQAWVSDDKRQAQAALKQGQQWLDQGCVGHSHFRFYQQAIETAWCFKQSAWLANYADQMEAYMAEEPNPWAELYVDKARILVDYLSKPQQARQKIQAFNERAKIAQLHAAAIILD